MSASNVIALGFFDGVHLAHQKIISAAAAYAKANGLCAKALTFDKAPAEVLRAAAPLSLTGNDEKRALISALGADCVMLPAEGGLFGMNGREFVSEVLIKQFSAAALFCGYNYTFGSDRLGACELAALGAEYGLHVEVLAEETLGGVPISSSLIRNMLAEGRPEAAAALLGRPYCVTGIVAEGKHLGRTMGFPTLNIYPEAGRALLRRGVYASFAEFGGERHIGVTNVGVNPTVGGEGIRIETYIPNFSANLYGVSVKTEFCRFIRPERKFASVNELFAQISTDSAETVRLLKAADFKK